MCNFRLKEKGAAVAAVKQTQQEHLGLKTYWNITELHAKQRCFSLNFSSLVK